MYIYFLLAICFLVIVIIAKTYYQRKATLKVNDTLYYFKGTLNSKILTNTELAFYQKLTAITNMLDLVIFPKIRLADLITTYRKKDFSKISAKHIDFTICKKDSSPILFIELDDKTHTIPKNQQNDVKKDYIFERLGVTLVRVKTNEQHQGLEYIDNVLREQIVKKK